MATLAQLRKTDDGINFIDSLPEEILRLVFEYLDLASVKAASLSCKRWHDVIFRTSFVGRFSFTMDLLLPRRYSYLGNFMTEGVRDPRTAITKRGIDILRHTERNYRNLNCAVPLMTIPEISALLTAMPYSLHTLKFAYPHPLLFDAIPRMPQLHSLTLGASSKEGYFPYWPYPLTNTPLTIRSNSVEYLELLDFLSILNSIAVDMPKLKTYVGPFSTLLESVNGAQTLLVPENLKHLIINHYRSVASKAHHLQELAIIHRLTHLETLEFQLDVRHEVLFAVCDSCIRLQMLVCMISNSSVLGHLSKLHHLRRLKCYTIGCTSEALLDLDFSQLTKLQDLQVRNENVLTGALIHSLILPKSLTTLYVDIDDTNLPNFIQTMKVSGAQLTKLTLHAKRRLKVKPIMWLSLLKNLEELVLRGWRFFKLDFLLLPAPLYRLRTLQFNDAWIENDELYRLRKVFPNLQTVRCFGSWRQISIEEPRVTRRC